MTIEDQIAALLAEAEPLRCLKPEEAEAKGLPALVNRINALRAKQAAGIRAQLEAVESAIEADSDEMRALAFKVQSDADASAFETERKAARKKPGPKPKAKAKIEGADA